MSLIDAESALNVLLASTLSGYNIVFENMGDSETGPYEPAVDETYVEQNWLPGRPVVIGYGECTKQRYLGIYQVTVSTPAYKGKKASDDVIALLETAFDIGTAVSYNSQTVRCREFYTGPPDRSQPGRFRVPVNIRFQADV